MMDTIKLTLEHNMFQADISYFQKETMNSARGFFSLVQNPTKSELLNGIYKPRLTLAKRFNTSGRFEPTLSVEFSLAKMLYGNNFEEFEDKDFEKIAELLQNKLKEMGVRVFWKILINAPVSSAHYSKNIPLLNGLTPYSVMKEIQKSNITKRLDFNQSDFRNEGHLIKYHANSFEIVFYDKIRDLEHAKLSDKRAFEEDSAIQTNLFNKFQEYRKRKPIEVLRMEIRLNLRQKIKKDLKAIGYDINPTFQNLVKKEISQKILLYYLDLIEAGYPKTLYFNPKSNKNFLAQFRIDNPKTKAKEAISALGFHNALQEITPRELRGLLNVPNRFIAKMNKYSYPKNALDILTPIRTCLQQFEPLKLLAIQDQMINNVKYE